MTSDFDLFEEEAARDAEERRRSIWTMLIVLCFAVVVAGLAVVLLFNSPGEKYKERQLAAPSNTASYLAPAGPSIRVIPSFTETVAKPRVIKSINPSKFVSTAASSASSGATPTATSSLIRTTSSARNVPSSPVRSTYQNTGPCPSYAACILGLDGGAVAAVQAHRHDMVPGYVTHAAQAQALSLAQGGSCGPGCAFEYAYSQNGPQVVDELFAGQTWLAAKHLTQFQVGWAYNPVNDLYYCAFLQG